MVRTSGRTKDFPGIAGSWRSVCAAVGHKSAACRPAGAELFDIVIRMDGLGTFAEEIKNCVEIALGHKKLKVLSLERILASKLAANRPKDKLTIPVLRDALAAAQASNPRGKGKQRSAR